MNKQVLFLTFFIITSILLTPILGRKLLVPFYYLPIYIYLFYKLLLNQSKIFLINKYIFVISFIFVIACLFTFINVTNFLSFIKYFLMWLLNLYLANYIAMNDPKKIFFKSSTISSILLISFFPLYHLLGFYPASFFNSFGFNVNQISFLVIFSVFYFLNTSHKKFLKTIIILPLFYLKSRMLILQSFIIYFISLKQKKILFILSLPAALLLAYQFSILNFISDIYNVLVFSNFELASGFDDTRRLTLLISGIKVIQNLFPFGTGLGLENFTFYSEHLLSHVDNFRSSMTHNFYISYTGIFGLMFVPFIISLFFPIYRKRNNFRYLVIIMFIGITFNEYITSPYFWVAYGTFLQKV